MHPLRTPVLSVPERVYQWYCLGRKKKRREKEEWEEELKQNESVRNSTNSNVEITGSLYTPLSQDECMEGATGLDSVIAATIANRMTTETERRL